MDSWLALTLIAMATFLHSLMGPALVCHHPWTPSATVAPLHFPQLQNNYTMGMNWCPVIKFSPTKTRQSNYIQYTQYSSSVPLITIKLHTVYIIHHIVYYSWKHYYIGKK